jgi:hypothetical protein
MSYEPPTPPANLPTEIVNKLNESSPERLRDVATYAEALAEHKEREAHLKGSADQGESDVRSSAVLAVLVFKGIRKTGREGHPRVPGVVQ